MLSNFSSQLQSQKLHTLKILLKRSKEFVRGVKVVKTVLLVMGVPRKFSRSFCKGLQGG